MLKLIPWDIWIAASAAIGIAVAAILEARMTPLVVTYFAVWTYVVLSTFFPRKE